nr:uncharacterized protein LOC111508102 [Leptinotarsa decemlineata]XP_023019292.1 uncharacterized protein LOC111508102 [Leptinotarsa decemlineata]XP_023019293.1 uncharacterized protein LOC111508102 [Leptinotarsa decemlineata]
MDDLNKKSFPSSLMKVSRESTRDNTKKLVSTSEDVNETIDITFKEEVIHRTDSETDTNSENEQGSAKRSTRDISGMRRYIGDFQIKDMEDPAKAKQYWFISRKRMKEYRKKVRMLSQYSRRLSNKIAYQKTLLDMAKDEDESNLPHLLPEALEAAKKKTIWVIKSGV